MKRSARRILSVLLAALLVLTMSAGAFAEEASIKQFNYYCSIGDSVAVCWGIDGADDYFPEKIRAAVGSESGYYYYDSCGLRTDEVLIALDELYYGMSADEIYAADDFYAVGGYNPENILSSKSDIQEGITNADLITLEFGSNDVFYSAQLRSGIANALSGSLSTDESAEIISSYTSMLWEGYDSFCENFPKVLEKIQQMKQGQEYTIVIVGTYNPINELRISDTIETPVGNIGSVVSAALNAKFEEFAETYGCLYADISNVELGAMSNEWTVEGGVFGDNYTASYATHPSFPEGYDYIARSILSQLSEEEPEIDTNIRVDLGSVKGVKSVIVGTTVIPSSDYSYDEQSHVLTVEYQLPNATMLTVSTDKGTTTGTSVYHLSYDTEKGYSAYLMYSTNDSAKAASRVFNNFSSVASSTVKIIGNLFSRK